MTNIFTFQTASFYEEKYSIIVLTKSEEYKNYTLHKTPLYYFFKKT